LLSRKIIRHAKRHGVEYSFLFVPPDGGPLAEIGKLLEAGRIRPVIDKVTSLRRRAARWSRLEFLPCFAVANPQTFPANITLESFGRRCLKNRHEERINDAPKKREAVYLLWD
jgi:hypothetical protein